MSLFLNKTEKDQKELEMQLNLITESKNMYSNELKTEK